MYKGCELSILAFARAARELPGAKLQIYGDGPARARLERLVSDLRLMKRVFFHGYVDEREVARALPSHDIFIQHSLVKEGSPVSIAEAMACGLPIVATAVGGITELVEQGETGLRVSERDVSGMAAAMLRLCLDWQLRQRFGQAGRARAVKLFDTSILTQRLNDLLVSIAAGA